MSTPDEERSGMAGSFESTDEVAVVKLRGRLSLREGQEFLETIYEEMQPKPRDVIVDLSGVSDMSSWGFALICGLARKLAETGHSLRIAGPSPFVRKYLQIFTGLKQPMEFYDSREDAVRSSRTRRGGSGRGPARR
ncbi:MAG: STAS domain-containing protein [Planctomycetota bacterium]